MLWELFSYGVWGGGGDRYFGNYSPDVTFTYAVFFFLFLFFSGWGGGCNFTHMTSLNWGRQKGELGHSTVFYGVGWGGLLTSLIWGRGRETWVILQKPVAGCFVLTVES